MSANGITLKLDTKAMNALFPEGSEARIELQNAVKANVLEKVTLKCMTDDAKAEVRKIILNSEGNLKSLVQESLSTFFTSTKSWVHDLLANGTYTLNSVTRAELVQTMTSDMRAQIIKIATQTAEDILKDSAEIERFINSRVRTLVSEHLRKSVNSKIQKLLDEM